MYKRLRMADSKSNPTYQTANYQLRFVSSDPNSKALSQIPRVPLILPSMMENSFNHKIAWSSRNSC